MRCTDGHVAMTGSGGGGYPGWPGGYRVGYGDRCTRVGVQGLGTDGLALLALGLPGLALLAIGLPGWALPCLGYPG